MTCNCITGYCEAGTYLDGESCKNCPRGFYKDNFGNTRFEDCNKCEDSAMGEEKTTDIEGSEDKEDCFVCKFLTISVPKIM